MSGWPEVKQGQSSGWPATLLFLRLFEDGMLGRVCWMASVLEASEPYLLEASELVLPKCLVRRSLARAAIVDFWSFASAVM